MGYHNYFSQPNFRLRILFGVIALASLPFLSKAIRPARATFAPPTPQAQANFVRQIPLPINDVVYSPTTNRLYASVPSTVGAGGNSIKTINPVTGEITNSVYVGSEPNRLALADDGTSMYVALMGSFGMRRFNISTQTAGLEFSLGSNSTFGRHTVNDLAVQPGNPNVVGVARYYQGASPPQAGVAVFDNGVQRPNTGPGHIAGSDFIAFSSTPSTLYGGGTSGGLRTMTIDANGVTVVSTGSFAVGTRIKFDNGLIFTSTGQVITATSGNLLGTFSNATSNAFVSDSSVGRAYYLTGNPFGSPGPLTLRAYDINTFNPVGTLTIPNIQGTPTTLIRWASNGFAFRTNANEFYVIQTSLIPSADPIPTPTATPSPTPSPSPSPFPAFVRVLSLPTNDLIMRASDQMLYATVPSSGGSSGNSIKQIDPVAGTIGGSFFVGSEPTRLAEADDGQTAYVFLNGAGAIRKVNLGALTAGTQFPVGLDNFNGVYSASDLAVAPGNPDLVGVARTHRNVSPTQAGVAVFDNGVQRTKTGPGHIDGPDFIVFESQTKLYGASFFRGLSTMTVDGTGVTVTGSVPFAIGSGIKLVNGLIYSTSGQVIEAATGIIRGTFSLGSGFSASTVAVDVANNRIFFMAQSFSSNYQIRAFNLSDFLPIGIATVPGISGTPSGLVRWGTNGLAFRTSNNQVFLVQTTLVNSSDPLPAATPTPSPTPSPSPPYIPTFVRRLSLPTNGLVYSTDTQALYASVPSSAGVNGNSITRIVPETGSIGPSTFVGSEPNRIALSDDGKTGWVNLNGANAIRRFDVPTLTPGLQFTTGSQVPADMEVLPGNSSALAVSRGGTVVIYDDGVQRPNTSSFFPSVGPIEFGASAATLYGYNSGSTGFDLVKFAVSSSGVSNVRSTGNLLTGFTNALEFSNGLLYSGSGRVADPEALKLAGTFPGVSASAIAVDGPNGRAFYVSGNGSNVVLTAFDINTFLTIGTVTLPGISGTPVNLVRWGTNGLAFNTTGNFTGPSSEVVILQTALVSSGGSIPTGVQLNVAAISTFEGTSNLNLTVTRTGDVSGTTNVDYATSDGTATAGSDYTAVSGTLTFAPGELTKTIPVTIINDALYEGANETFNLTLSNPTGGAVLASPAAVAVTISDNDPKPSISIAFSFTRAEGNAPATFTFPVNLSNPSVQTLTVDYTTADNTATAGSDYVAASGTLTFPPGTTSQSISVTVNGDTIVEPNETFFLRLNNPTNASFISNSQSTVTLTNDDTAVTVAVLPSGVIEDETANLVYTFTRAGVTSGPLTVNFSVGGTAGFGTDYIQSGANSFTSSSGTVTFSAGNTIATVTVDPIADTTVESDETIVATLTPGANYTVGNPNLATGTIVTDDAPVLVLESGSNYVLAIDSVTFVQNPPSVAGGRNFSSDQQTRVMIFTSNLGLSQPSSDLAVTAGGVPLTIEAVGTLSGAPQFSYVIVKLDPVLVGDVHLTVTLLGVTSNAGVLRISP